MNLNPDRKLTTRLFNPFIHTADVQALWIGLAAILIAGGIGALSDSHFDGVLDFHTGSRSMPLWILFSEGIVNWLCLSAVLVIAGKIISKTAFRMIDVFGTQALARWPSIFLALIVLPMASKLKGLNVSQHSQLEPSTEGMALTIFFGLVMIPFVCWMVLLMYRAFSLCCNVRGAKAIWTFIAGLLLAEILSKIIINGLFHLI
ncbi:MAG: hypothetical protein ABJC04_04815 [Verrucomicrobiota bacterium]